MAREAATLVNGFRDGKAQFGVKCKQLMIHMSSNLNSFNSMKPTQEIDARIKQLEAEQKVLIRLLTEKKPAKAPTPKTPEPEPEPEPDGNPMLFGLLLIVLASATPISVIILLTLI